MKINQRRAFICGLNGATLKKKEISFLKKYKPWGIILFSRNIKSIDQTQKLTLSIKNIFKNTNYPILIDEEGGRISRLKKIIDTSQHPASFFGNLYNIDKKKFKLYLDVYINQLSYLLKTLGINVNTVPVLDVRRKSTHKIIGDRSFSNNQKIVSKIGDICISKFHKKKIATVIKHIPGHGLAKLDSHKTVPYINKPIKYLKKIDFYTFKNKKSILAMTAHVVFSKIDPNNTVTHSKKMIEIIKKNIGFKNLIISDDLSMKALKYSLKENVNKAFTAGCNIVLHCNGKFQQMLLVAKNSPKINKFILKKTSQFRSIIS